jgi:hypothetical protein
MRIGHERAGDRDRQLARVPHLRERVWFEVAAPNAVRGIALARTETVSCLTLIDQLLRQLSVLIVIDKARRLDCQPLQILHDRRHVLPGGACLLQHLLGPFGARTRGESESNEFACVHASFFRPRPDSDSVHIFGFRIDRNRQVQKPAHDTGVR